MNTPDAEPASLFARIKNARPVSFGMRVYERYRTQQLPPLTASFAYFWVFALPPLILLIVMIAALLNRITDLDITERLRDQIIQHAPQNMQALLLDLVDTFLGQVSGETASVAVIIAAGVALWSASGAINILIIGFNRAYAVVDSRSMVRRRLKTLALTIAFVLFINLSFVLIIFGERIGRWVTDWLGMSNSFEVFWDFSRIPIAIAGIALILAVLYWAGPDVDQPFRLITPGSLFAALGWLALLGGFGLYLAYANPGSAYGAVGSVIVLLMFLKLSGTIFFLGAVINAIRLEDESNRSAAALREPAMAAVNQ